MTVLELRDVVKEYKLRDGLHTRKLRAVDQVSFRLEPGRTIALVGQSGSGKSTIAKLLMQLERPTAGEILVNDEPMVYRGTRAAAYRKAVQMVFQDPFASLNPYHTVGHHLARPLRLHHPRLSREQLDERVLELLRRVRLDPAEDFVQRKPHELSGGQRQRVAIARALAPSPGILVADEPVSMLDVSIRLGVLNLLATLQREENLGVLYITHDLATARHFSDEIMVLYRGEVVERGPADDVILESTARVHPAARRRPRRIRNAGWRSSSADLRPARSADRRSAALILPGVSLAHRPDSRRLDHRRGAGNGAEGCAGRCPGSCCRAATGAGAWQCPHRPAGGRDHSGPVPRCERNGVAVDVRRRLAVPSSAHAATRRTGGAGRAGLRRAGHRRVGHARWRRTRANGEHASFVPLRRDGCLPMASNAIWSSISRRRPSTPPLSASAWGTGRTRTARRSSSSARWRAASAGTGGRTCGRPGSGRVCGSSGGTPHGSRRCARWSLWISGADDALAPRTGGRARSGRDARRDRAGRGDDVARHGGGCRSRPNPPRYGDRRRRAKPRRWSLSTYPMRRCGGRWATAISRSPTSRSRSGTTASRRGRSTGGSAGSASVRRGGHVRGRVRFGVHPGRQWPAGLRQGGQLDPGRPLPHPDHSRSAGRPARPGSRRAREPGADLGRRGLRVGGLVLAV